MEAQDSVIKHEVIDIKPRLKINIQRGVPDDQQPIDMEEEESESRQVIDIKPRLKI